ncbi:MAG: extracellular solute-binding protein, partial [Paenibacillus sp.]|nr:extracellular solute-binding protein [Paenibacillus sp.]
MRKLITASIAGLLALSLAACANNGNTEASGTDNTTGTNIPAGPLDKYAPPIEVTAVRPISEGTTFKEGEDIANNNWSRAYEEQLGIKVKYDWTVAQSQYAQKLNISIASDDLPDVFQVSAAQLKKLVEDGQLADLTELYEKYASPFVKQTLSEDGGNALLSTKFDGRMMALPKMGSGIGQSHVLWVRTDWLNKLNLPEPRTMADFFNISEAFTTGDPDGNGVADTSGFGLNRDLWGFFAAAEGYFNGYHAYPNTWIKNDAGELVYGSIQPEMRQALQKL